MFRFLSQPAEKLLERATKLKLEGKFDRAISLLEKSAKEYPNNFQILLELGTLYFQTDQHKSACTIFKKAQRLSPSTESNLLSTVESLHFERGKPVESAELLLEIYAERKELEQAERILSSLTDPQLRQVAKRYEEMFANSIKYRPDSMPQGVVSERSLTLAYCLAALYSTIHDYSKTFSMFQKIMELSDSESNSVLKEAQRIATKEWGNPQLLISLADLYAKTGAMEKAAEDYLRATELDSTKTEEVVERIRKLLKKAESEPLLKSLTQLMISSGQFDEALSLIGRLEKLGTNPEQITRYYGEVARLAPSSPHAHLLLGDRLYEEERLDSAASEYLKVAELDPKKTELALDRLEKILAKDPANEYVVDVTFDICFSNLKLEKAVQILAKAYETNRAIGENIVEKLSKILEKNLSRVDALSLLGKIYLDRGDYQKSIVTLTYLGQISEEGARRALPLLLEIVEKKPELTRAKIALADTNFNLKNFEKAFELYFESLDSSPDMASSIVPKIDLLTRERRSLANSAALLYSEKKYLDPLVLHYSRAEAFALAGSYSEAIEDLKWCIENYPDRIDDCIAAYQRMLNEAEIADVRLALGDAYIKIGKVREALEEFNRGVSLDSKKFREVLQRLYRLKAVDDSGWIRKKIVDLLIENQLHSQAFEEIQSALEKFPSDRGYFYLSLAKINQEKGIFGEVTSNLKKAIQEDCSLATSAIQILKRQAKMGKADLPCLMVLVDAYELTKQYDKAIDELKRITEYSPEKIDWVLDRLKKISEDNPANPRLSWVRGQLLLNKRDVEGAIEDFSRTSNLDRDYLHKIEEIYENFLHSSPTNPHILLALARLKVEKGSFPEAVRILAQLREPQTNLRGPVIRELQRIIERNPQSPEAMRALVELYTEEEKYDLSLDLLEKLINLKEKEIPWAMRELKRLEKRIPGNPRCLRTMGHGYLKLGDLKKSCQIYDSLIGLGEEELSKALVDLKKMVESYPENSNILFLHARMLLKKGLVRDACSAFRKLVNLNPSFDKKIVDELGSIEEPSGEAEFINLLLGDLLERMEQYDKAVDVLKSGLKRAQCTENIIDFHILLANAYSALKKHKQAQKALRIAKNRAESKEQFFRRLVALREERINFEILKLKSVLEKNPDDYSTRIGLAKLLRNMGKTEEAVEILRLPTEDPRYQKERALEVSLCLSEDGEISTALEILNSLPIGDPPQKIDLEILYTLANLNKRMGNFLPAIACFKMIRRIAPQYRETTRLLSQEYEKLIRFRLGLAGRTIAGILR